MVNAKSVKKLFRLVRTEANKEHCDCRQNIFSARWGMFKFGSTVQYKSTGRKLQLKLVLPAQATLGLDRIFVFAPMRTAVIGYRKGQLIKWQMPCGKKEFLIVDALNAKFHSGIYELECLPITDNHSGASL